MIEEKQIYFKNKDIIIEGTTYLIPPNPKKGYTCGYSIFVPKRCKKDTSLIMHFGKSLYLWW